MINRYGYKPEPRFGYKNDRESREHLTFGVELECEPRRDGAPKMDADELSDRIDEIASDRVYCKSDASLSHGLEIVTHPGTLAHHMYVMHWRQIQRTCEKAGFRSHDTENSGLHVHVGREQLGNTDAEREETIRKVQVLFVLYAAELTRFSRRARSRLDEWASFRSFGMSPDSIRATDGDTLATWARSSVPTFESGYHDRRYTAVNLMNLATIEFRIFRGTLKRDTLIAAIQLTSNICEYAMSHTWGELRTSTWADVAACKPYKEIVNYMIARGLLDADAAPETLPGGNRAMDYYGVDGIARPAHA